jgi:hypothetical protein
MIFYKKDNLRIKARLSFSDLLLLSMDYKKPLNGMFFAFHLSGGFMNKDKMANPVFNEIKIIATGYTRPGAQNAENEVNRLLQTGWVLLETYTTCYSNTIPSSSQQEVHFVLGKKDAVQPEQAVNTLHQA